jgi:hypothetical protein
MADTSARPQLRHLDVLSLRPIHTSNYRKEDEQHPISTSMLNSDRVNLCGEGGGRRTARTTRPRGRGVRGNRLNQDRKDSRGCASGP